MIEAVWRNVQFRLVGKLNLNNSDIKWVTLPFQIMFQAHQTFYKLIATSFVVKTRADIVVI